MNRVPRLRTGDIVLFSDRSMVSRWIRWLTRSHGEGKTRASHVGVMADSENICEALATVKIHPVAPRLKSGWREIYRLRGLRWADRVCIRRQCRASRGQRYGVLKVAAQAADGLLGKVFGDVRIFRRLCLVPDRPICSQLVAEIMNRCAAPDCFGVPANSATPDDIRDACEDLGRFMRVWKSEKGR